MPSPPAPLRRVDAFLGWMESSPTRRGCGSSRASRSARSCRSSSCARCSRCRSRPSPATSRCSRGRAGSRAGGRGRRASTASEALAPGARRLWLLARAESERWPAVRHDAERLSAVRARRDGAERFFAGAAGAWDKLRAEVYGQAVGAEALLALLPPSWTVADLGCGTGALAAELAPRVRRVVAVDQSAAMLRAARRRRAKHENVELHEARLEALPLADGCCDAALARARARVPRGPRRGAARGGAHAAPRAGGSSSSTRRATPTRTLRRRMGQRSPGFDAAELAALVRRPALGRPACRTVPPEPGREGPRARHRAARARRAATSLPPARTRRPACRTNRGRRPGRRPRRGSRLRAVPAPSSSTA